MAIAVFVSDKAVRAQVQGNGKAGRCLSDPKAYLAGHGDLVGRITLPQRILVK